MVGLYSGGGLYSGEATSFPGLTYEDEGRYEKALGLGRSGPVT
jgi:hypothetical protein